MDKMATMSQTIFSDAFLCEPMSEQVTYEAMLLSGWVFANS